MIAIVDYRAGNLTSVKKAFDHIGADYVSFLILTGSRKTAAAELTWDRKFFKALATFAAGTLSVFVIGLPWLGFVAHLDVPTTLAYGLYPFLIPGAIKAVIAAGLLPLAWFGANKLKRRDSDA